MRGRKVSSLGEQVPQQVRDPEGDEEGVRDPRRAEEAREAKLAGSVLLKLHIDKVWGMYANLDGMAIVAARTPMRSAISI